MQAFCARAPPASSVTITVQAPQSPSLQPSLVPFSPRLSRSQSNNVCGRLNVVQLHGLSVQKKRDIHRGLARVPPYQTVIRFARPSMRRRRRAGILRQAVIENRQSGVFDKKIPRPWGLVVNCPAALGSQIMTVCHESGRIRCEIAFRHGALGIRV